MDLTSSSQLFQTLDAHLPCTTIDILTDSRKEHIDGHLAKDRPGWPDYQEKCLPRIQIWKYYDYMKMFTVPKAGLMFFFFSSLFLH